MNGWFKFHRKTFENPVIMKDADTLAVWMWLLTKANYEETRDTFNNKEIKLKKGQLTATSKQISSDLKVEKNKVDRILKKFESDRQIDRQKDNRKSLITVLNWEKYQSSDSQIDTQMIIKCDTDDNQVIDSCDTDDTLSYYIKKERKEEIEEDKKDDKPKKNEPTTYYPNDGLLDSAFKEFLVMRNKIKKPLATKQALTRMMNRIEKLSYGDNDLAIKILNQSTDHCWQDVYELKGENKSFHSTTANTQNRSREEKLANLLQKIKEGEENGI